MSEQAPITAQDDITSFMGEIPAAEYEQRRRLRTLRNAATFKAGSTKSADVSALCWMVNERASEWIYAPAEPGVLAEVVTLCRRLMMVGDQIELLETRYYG